MVSSRTPQSALGPSLSTKFFGAGAAACIADCITFPLDTAKVRLQIQGESGSKPSKLGVSSTAEKQAFKYKGPIGTIRVIIREEGAKALYNGIVPGLQRQMCFASIRIGSYDSFKDFFSRLYKNNPQEAPSFLAKMSAGVTSGAIAILIAQPTDVVKVRMQAQKAGVPARYSGTLNAYKTIASTEGVRGLWKGMVPNIARNVVINCSELVTYDMVKSFILTRNLLSDNLPCHFVSGIGAGFCATVVASPVDVVKTRYMNSSEGQYRGVIQCASTMFKEGGFFAFYKGFLPSFLRLGSWNIVMFTCYEQIKRFLSTNRQVLVH
ncbi:mitochondrial uncoupling protein 2-like [Argonauta hians]